jgi:hypothetical protein
MQEREDFSSFRSVQVAHRIIGDQDQRLMRDRAANREQRLLPHRQFARKSGGTAVQMQSREDLRHALGNRLVTPSSCNGADFNRDANVNSIDFSVLLAFWQTPWPFRNACVDINGDKAVGSSDFSVLMYEWGTRK